MGMSGDNAIVDTIALGGPGVSADLSAAGPDAAALRVGVNGLGRTPGRPI
jgi:hypothetical protein